MAAAVAVAAVEVVPSPDISCSQCLALVLSLLLEQGTY